MCGPVISVRTVKYVWNSNYIVDSQVCVDQQFYCGQSSSCGPEITLWTVKYVWTSNFSQDSQVRVD